MSVSQPRSRTHLFDFSSSPSHHLSSPLTPSFANLFTKLACKIRLENTTPLRRVALGRYWLSKVNEANARGKIMWSDPEKRAKVQVTSFEMQLSLARCCGRRGDSLGRETEIDRLAIQVIFYGGWWAPTFSHYGWWARKYCWIYVPVFTCSNTVLLTYVIKVAFMSILGLWRVGCAY